MPASLLKKPLNQKHDILLEWPNILLYMSLLVWMMWSLEVLKWMTHLVLLEVWTPIVARTCSRHISHEN